MTQLQEDITLLEKIKHKIETNEEMNIFLKTELLLHCAINLGILKSKIAGG
jgi:hypothetical protein